MILLIITNTLWAYPSISISCINIILIIEVSTSLISTLRRFTKMILQVDIAIAIVIACGETYSSGWCCTPYSLWWSCSQWRHSYCIGCCCNHCCHCLSSYWRGRGRSCSYWRHLSHICITCIWSGNNSDRWSNWWTGWRISSILTIFLTLNQNYSFH